MDAFTQQLHDWQVFYSTVAMASVTLAGLLFVSLSIRREVIKGSKHTLTRRMAQGSFADFLYVLMLGLVFLVPHPAPIGLAVALFVLGGSRVVGLLRNFVRSKAARPERRNVSYTMREIALPALASLGLLIVGIEVLRGDMASMYGLVIVVAALLSTASWNAWLILLEENISGS